MKLSKKLPAEDRFWLMVNKEGPINSKFGECWLWGKRKKGYGDIYVDGRNIKAHRYSWVLHNRKIPQGLQVLHKCDNPCCVNPSHLFLGSQDINMKDMASKKRGNGKPPLGENNG